MSHTTMNMSQLAKYLHFTEQQVRRLVDSGAIPSRRVGGEQVFSEDEVHRWLETRIGLSDNAELIQVEAALDRSAPADSDENSVTITGLIPEGAVAIPFQARTRDSAIRGMVQLASQTGLLWDATAMFEAVKTREELHSTALDNGVALLHSRRPMSGILGDSFLTIGILPNGIHFGGGFSNRTDVFFLICSLNDRIHLRILTRLSRLLSMPGFIDSLREQENEAELRARIEEAEAKLFD